VFLAEQAAKAVAAKEEGERIRLDTEVRMQEHKAGLTMLVIDGLMHGLG